jgi:spore maturation protein B
MALLRPLSGSGAYGVMVDIMKAHGPDSFIGILAGALNGSTETTFYVLTLYLGAARVRDGRHALIVCLAGDVAGFLVATAACRWLFA